MHGEIARLMEEEGKQFHKDVKRGLEDHGYSISKWCRDNEESRVSLAAACKFIRNGKKSRRLRKRLASMLGLKVPVIPGEEAAECDGLQIHVLDFAHLMKVGGAR